jgi:hypothetical protein
LAQCGERLGQHPHRSASDPENAEDVVVKAVPERTALKTNAAAKETTDSATQTQRMSSNDQKVLAFLRKSLDRRS